MVSRADGRIEHAPPLPPVATDEPTIPQPRGGSDVTQVLPPPQAGKAAGSASRAIALSRQSLQDGELRPANNESA
jgi:hypothetical protein